MNRPASRGRGADFGCGLGILARAVLKSDKVAALALIALVADRPCRSGRAVFQLSQPCGDALAHLAVFDLTKEAEETAK